MLALNRSLTFVFLANMYFWYIVYLAKAHESEWQQSLTVAYVFSLVTFIFWIIGSGLNYESFSVKASG